MTKRFTSAVVALIMGLGLAVAVQAPASASWSDCPAGQGCVYINSNGGNPILGLTYSSVGGVYKCWNFADNWNDAISSVKVRYGSGEDMKFFKDADCTGTATTVANGAEMSYHGWPRVWNDVISSFMIVP